MLVSVERFLELPSAKQCLSGAMKVSWAQSHKMIGLILWTVTLTLPNANAMMWPTRVLNESRELTKCEGLGFSDATLNNCGYCTLGNTGLLANYSMDCGGSCSKKAVVDCAGVCGGRAYIDECSGQCIGGNTGLTEDDVKEYRDCRGYCKSSGGQFSEQECGMCSSGSYPFQDCTNKCYLPGSEYKMAKIMCGRCVGTNTELSPADVLDACGNCKGGNVDCPCDGVGEPDVCGVCNDGGRSCMKVVDFHPKALPANLKYSIAIKGAFLGETQNIKCVFIHDESGNRTEVSASVNGTRALCPVRLKAGIYRVGIILNSSSPKSSFYEDNELFVYGEADYTSMTPTKAVFDRDGSQSLMVTFSGGKVPNLPLICIVTGEGWPASQRLSPGEPNTLDACEISYPKSSIKLNIAPSFNGIHPFKKSFTLRFYASPPEMRENYIAEDGHAAVIAFDRPVNLCKLKTCEDLLDAETFARFPGKSATCQWATKQQLIITVQSPIRTNPLRVTFKKGVLMQDFQKYPLPKNESRTVDVYYPHPASNAQLKISGPATIPNCGTFTLVGHFSSPKGDAEYFWTAFRGDQRPLETTVANALLAIRTTSLTLNASLLEIDMNYTFVLTAEHPVGEKYEAKHNVLRKSYIGPLITAYSDVMSQPSVTVDQKIMLYAEIRLPECGEDSERMNLMWSVNNPKVKFDFNNRHMVVYRIEPYTLPENTEVIFTAFAYFGNMLNVTSSHILLRVEQFQLKAAIKGSAKRIVGNKEGDLVLESEVSTLNFPVVYQWKCYEEERLICYNYKRNSKEPLLVPRKMQTLPKLVIPCESLKAGQTLTFELQVFNANNSRQYSQVASTQVIVEDRNVPQVVIDSVIADETHRIGRNPNTGAYSIPAGLPVMVNATISPVDSQTSVKWQVKGFSSSFTYTTIKNKSILSLEEGFLVGHGIYLIGLSACSKKRNCGIANLTIHAIPGIALCKLEVDSFVEYEMVNAVVKGCSIPLGRQPVTYQMFIQSQESVFPLTAPQTPTSFSILGPAYQSEKGTQMSVEVCDTYSLCKMFPGPLVEVAKSDIPNARDMVIKKAILADSINDPLNALTLFLTVASGPDAKLTKSEIDTMLNAGARASKNRYLNRGELSLIYSAMLPLIRNEDNNVKLKALDVIKRATVLVFGHKVKVPTAILAQGHSNTAEALLVPSSNSAVIDYTKEVLDFFVKKISTTAPLGSRIQLSSDKPGYPSTLIFRKLLDNSPVNVKTLSKNGLLEGTVHFEKSVQELVRNRDCEGDRCDGIVVALILYPDRNPYPSAIKKTSPVLDITLLKPENGEEFEVRNMPNGVRISLSHNGSNTDSEGKSIQYTCAYWDPQTKEWLEEGVNSFGPANGMMRCWSSHLTPFTTFVAAGGLSVGSIVGIVVIVLMGVFIILMLAFFYFRKKIAAKSRVSSEALQPKRHLDKMGMNGAHVRVKTITP